MAPLKEQIQYHYYNGNALESYSCWQKGKPLLNIGRELPRLTAKTTQDGRLDDGGIARSVGRSVGWLVRGRESMMIGSS